MALTLERIAAHQARIGVVGLGYVGLPLALSFAEAGFPVIGFDTDPHKPLALAGGRSYLDHIPDARVAAVAGRFLWRSERPREWKTPNWAMSRCSPAPPWRHASSCHRYG